MYKLLALSLFLWFSCTTTQPTTGESSGSGESSGNVIVQPADTGTRNPIGSLVNIPTSVSENNKKRMEAYGLLGAPYVRHTLTMQTWEGSNDFYNKLNAAGYKVLLNVVATPQLHAARPFPTDMVTYSKKLNDILDVYKPEVLVVENEEYNQNYYTGSMKEYLEILKTGIKIAHERGIKVTNGGLTARILTLVTYYDYRSRGMIKEAEDFAKRTQPPHILAILPNLSKNQGLSNGVKAMDTLIAAYKTMNLDYVNFHWYEPITNRNPRTTTSEGIDDIDTKAIGEVVDFLKRVTGKEVITNEIGQLNESPKMVQSILEKCVSLQLPYVIWYSGDGDGPNKATALHNSDGTLRPNGQAFVNFIKQKFPR